MNQRISGAIRLVILAPAGLFAINYGYVGVAAVLLVLALAGLFEVVTGIPFSQMQDRFASMGEGSRWAILALVLVGLVGGGVALVAYLSN